MKRGPEKIIETSDGSSLGLVVEKVLSKSIAVPLLSTIQSVVAAYEEKLQSVAHAAGIALPKLEINSDSPAIVATGHQSVVYHPGLLEKEIQALALAKNCNATAVNFVLDLDEQDGCSFIEPTMGISPALQPVSFGDGAGILASQKIQSVPKTHYSRGHSEEAKALYQKLIGQPISVAHAIVRRVITNVVIAHVPSSILMARPEVQAILRKIASDPSLLATYHTTLNNYRTDHRIKNAANPFPNIADGELPFWISGTTENGTHIRRAMNAQDLHDNHAILVPRGAMVSLFLRCFCASLFIHGLGGKSYESCVELLISALGLTNPAPYIVVSANRYPFDDTIKEYERLETLMTIVRSGPSQIPKLLEICHWSDADRALLNSLASKKNQLLSELNQAKNTKGDTRSVGIAIKALDNEIRNVLAENSNLTTIIKSFESLETQLPTIFCRTAPYFYFS